MQTMRQSRLLRFCAVMLAAVMVFTMIPMDGIAYAAVKKPVQVKNVTLSAKTKTSLKVKWKKVANAKTYQVAYKKAGTKKYTYKKTKDVSYNVASLKSGVKYTVKVRAINGKKYGKWSAEKNFKTKNAVTPAQTKNLKLSKATKVTLTAKWAKAKSAERYQIAYKKNGAKAYKFIKTAKRTYTISNLESGVKYKVKVRAINGSKYGKWSSEKTLKTKNAKQPAAMQNVKLEDKTSSSIKMSWSRAKNAEQYEVAYKKVGAKNYKTATTKKLNYTITGLKTDTAYYIKVRGVNGSKSSKWSTAKKYRTQINYNKAADEADVVVSATDENIVIDIKSMGMNNKATLYRVGANEYLKADSISGIVEKNVTGKKVGTFSMNKAKTFKLTRIGSDGHDKLYDKYYVVSNGSIIRGPIYTTSVDAMRGDVTLDVPSKKGLVDELDEQSFEIAEDVGSNWTAVNIDFTDLILANETADGKPIDNSSANADTIEVNGKTYYINSSAVAQLDSRVARYTKMGINVVGVCISFVETESSSKYPRALKYIDDARWTNGFNTSNDLGRDYFIAGMEYLANRYSKGNKGLICNYVIGNEVDYSYDWYEIIPNNSVDGKKLPPRGSKYLRDGEIETRADFDAFMEEYSRTLRLANLAVKQYSEDISVGISLSKEWAKSKGEQQGATPSKNKRYDSYRPKEMLDWLNYYTKKSGDFDWSVTQHNYPVENGNAAAVETGLTGATPVVTGDPDTSTMITQSNMEVVQMYLDRKQNLYRGNAREIYLTENGSSSGSEVGTHSLEMQKEQAAAVAQHYYRAASLPSVKSIIYYKITDRAAEGSTSFKLGLLDTNGQKKLAYDLWKYIDTSRSFDISKKYLGSISFLKDGQEYSKAKGNINSYLDVMSIVKSNFDWSKYWNEDAMTPIKLEETKDEAALSTDKTVYGADDPILVTASGSSTDLVGLYKRGETVKDTPIYSYEVGGETGGMKHKSGKTYDIRAYGIASVNRLEDAKLPAGEYTIILSSDEEELLSINITITGKSAFEGVKKVTTNKTTYMVGEDIIVTASGTGSDWVGLYKVGEKADSALNGGSESIYWYYVNNGTQISGKPFVLQNGYQNVNSSNPGKVVAAGEYYLVLLENDGYKEIARTETITIEGSKSEGLVSATYELDNATDGFSNGTVTITRKEDSSTSACLMFWGDENGKKLEGYAHLAKMKLTGTTTSERMQAGTIIPPGAKTLLAYAYSGGKESGEPVVIQLPEGAAFQFESDENVMTSFAVGSDLHLVTGGNGNDFNENTNEHFEIAIRDMQKNLPEAEHFFANGDIADHGMAGEFREAMNILMGIEDAPTMHMSIGNHDWRTGNPDRQFQKYVNWFNPAVEPETVYYDEWVDGYHHIYLGSEAQGTVAYLSNPQLEWFENLLAEDAEKNPDQPVFVWFHHGLQDSMAGNYPGQWGYTNGVGQDARLKKILSKYGQIVMFGGHTHYELDTDNSVTLGSDELPVSVNTASIGYLWDAYNIQAGEYMYGAHGYFVKVFKDKIYMFGRNFISGEYMPSAMYVIDPAKLTIEQSKISMYVGDDNINLGADTEEGMQLTYKSSNPKVATVDYRGNVRAIAPGTAKIYISTESSETKAVNRKTVTVTVE